MTRAPVVTEQQEGGGAGTRGQQLEQPARSSAGLLRLEERNQAPRRAAGREGAAGQRALPPLARFPAPPPPPAGSKPEPRLRAYPMSGAQAQFSELRSATAAGSGS